MGSGKFLAGAVLSTALLAGCQMIPAEQSVAEYCANPDKAGEAVCKLKLEIDGNTAKMSREIEGGKEYLEAELPLVLGCQEPIAEWKIPNMRGIMTARTKPLNVVEPADDAVRTKLSTYELPPEKGAVKMIDADNVAELVDLLKNEAKVL